MSVAPTARPPMDVATEVGSREFVRPLIRLGVPARLRKLESGDMAWYGNGPEGLARFGVERKRVAEVVGADARARYITRQLPKMLERYHFTFLLIEGLVRVDPSDGSLQSGKEVKDGKLTCWLPAGWGRDRGTYTTYTKMELSLRLLTTVHVVHTANATETAWWLHGAYMWSQKSWTAHTSVLGIETSIARDGIQNALITSDRTMRRQIFASLPGIGWAKSARVSRYFPSVKQAASADETQWMQALGLKKGKITARRIIGFLNGDEPDREAKG